MSVLTSGCRDSHAADGVRVAFAYGFRILDAAHLTVTLRSAVTGAETAQVLNTHYTVTGVGAPGGGTVVFPAPPPPGHSVVIVRTMAAGDHGYPGVTADQAFDRLALLAQQAQDAANRSVRFPEGDSPSLSARLPSSPERAGKALAFDANGNVALVSLASPTFDAGFVEWAEIRNTPRTLSGFGILDGTPSSHAGSGGAAHAVASAGADGFMSAADKAKLDRFGAQGPLRGCLLTLAEPQMFGPGLGDPNAGGRIVWSSMVWDSDGCFRPETPTRVVTPSWARFVRLSVQLEVSAAMNGRRELTIRRNGGAEYPGRTVMRCCGNGTDWNVLPNAITPWLPVTAGDWFDAHLGQTSSLAFELPASGGTWMQAEFA
ncbi:hypothetical protein ACIU1J_08610 [Azospirillum doebereinerae]|uniref:hypothetical protein n=1 Tax=Azospirillum doebereinerae TaxID=92933 RepID=UPI001EE55D3D|nr:hypothetical protein [Azospirillum doebereinerae]MCG5240114.1 hypothetical protein [Azospirillum doebereinerae]